MYINMYGSDQCGYSLKIWSIGNQFRKDHRLVHHVFCELCIDRNYDCSESSDRSNYEQHGRVKSGNGG